MSKIAVIYWSQTGNTEMMANAIAEGIPGSGRGVRRAQRARGERRPGHGI